MINGPTSHADPFIRPPVHPLHARALFNPFSMTFEIVHGRKIEHNIFPFDCYDVLTNLTVNFALWSFHIRGSVGVFLRLISRARSHSTGARSVAWRRRRVGGGRGGACYSVGLQRSERKEVRLLLPEFGTGTGSSS